MLLIITLIATLLALFYYTKKLKNYPPGPRFSYPILGSLHLLDPVKPYITLTELAKKHGPIYGLQMGSVYAVVISNDAIIREAFKSEQFIGRAPLYVTHGIMGGYGKLQTSSFSSYVFLNKCVLALKFCTSLIILLGFECI